MRSGELGPLSFGMGSSIALTLLAPMVLQLLTAAPLLRVSTLVQTTNVLLEALKREELDFFIGDIRAAEHDGSNFSAEPVYPCTFSWFARKDHPLAGRDRLGMSDLKHYPLMLLGHADESLLRRLAQLYEFSMPVQDHFAISTNDIATAIKLLTFSDVIAPSTDVALISEYRMGTLVRLDVRPALDLELTLGIIEHRAQTRLPVAERAYDVVRAHFSAVAQEVAQSRTAGSSGQGCQAEGVDL